MKELNNIEQLERKLDKLQKEPQNPILFNDIGTLLYQMRDWKNAELYLQKAYELCVSNKDILYNYASLLYSQFKWQKAVSIFKQYLELNPEDKEVIKKLGDACYLLGEYETAAKYIISLKKV